MIKSPKDPVQKSKLGKDIFAEEILLGLDSSSSNSDEALKAIRASCSIDYQFDNILIDIHLKELSINLN